MNEFTGSTVHRCLMHVAIYVNKAVMIMHIKGLGYRIRVYGYDYNLMKEKYDFNNYQMPAIC